MKTQLDVPNAASASIDGVSLFRRRKTPNPGEIKFVADDGHGLVDAGAPVLFVGCSASGRQMSIVRRPTIRLSRDAPTSTSLAVLATPRRNTAMPSGLTPPVPNQGGFQRMSSRTEQMIEMAPPASSPCLVSECGNPATTQDLCTLHYQRALRIHTQINQPLRTS
jgi:hypothetical protein